MKENEEDRNHSNANRNIHKEGRIFVCSQSSEAHYKAGD